jgi:DNA-binding NtrC family response regulator
MFRLASFDLSSRRILVVESEDAIAEMMAEEIRQSGGFPLGRIDDVVMALGWIGNGSQVDCVMLDVRQVVDTDVPIVSAFGKQGVEVVFVTGFDDWYLAPEG